MLRLILGRARSGKTTKIMDEIKRGGSSVLIVPEQYSHEAERELLRVCGDGMSLKAEVVSFSRLASRVLAERGYSLRRRLDGGGRLLCMSLALHETGSRLSLFAAARRRPELQAMLLDAVDELKTACVTPDALASAAETLASPTGPKLAELAMIYSAFEAIAARSGLDPVDELTRLAEVIAETSPEKTAWYIDGFTDFTAQQRALIQALLRAGAEVAVCLTCEGFEEGHEIFEPSRRAACALRRSAQSVGAETAVEYGPGAPASEAMAAVERELFSFGDAVCASNGEIALQKAADMTAECEGAARRCLQLVRSGCRWRDIAIAARGFEDYRAVLESVFSYYGVPLYTARRSEVMLKPLPALIEGAFEIISGGWSYEDVFSYLRTGLAGLTAEETDELENYVFLWSLHGSAWYGDRPWSQNPGGYDAPEDEAAEEKLGRINELRARVAEPLTALMNSGREAKTALGQARALAEYFERLRLPEILDARSRALREAGLAQEAAEYAQLWRITVHALEQCASILGEAEMEQETFGRLFCLILSDCDVGTIPLTLDAVSAGDMDRMRRRSIKHLIVLGCDSSRVPNAAPEAGVLSDDDRLAMREAGIDVGDCAAERLMREFALAYNCLTLPKQTLLLSRSALTADGGETQPSFIVTRAMKVFSLSETAVDPAACRLEAPEPAFGLALGGAGARGALAERYFRANGRGGELDRLRKGAEITRGRLSAENVRLLYGDRLRLSASRAEKLAGCRFAYFMQYGLGAKPRQPAAFSPPEFGAFMHYVLQNVAAAVAEQGGFAAVKPERVRALCDEYVEKYVSEKLNDFRDKSQRFIYLFRRLTKDVYAVVSDMAQELAKSDFVPLDFELSFGSEFPPIELGEGGDAVTLTGIADRVDGWYRDGRLYVRVVDYKTGSKSFSLSDVWYGLGLQMLMYLFALERAGGKRYGAEIVPAGVLYIPARDVLVRADANISDEEIISRKAKKLTRSGLLLDDGAVLSAMEHGEEPQYIPVKLKGGEYSGESLASAERLGMLSRHIDRTLRSMAAELRSGSVAADPCFRSANDGVCRNCDYFAACRFDSGKDEPRVLKKLAPDEFWDRLEAEDK